MHDHAGVLPGFSMPEPPPHEEGEVEAATRQAIEVLRAGGWVTEAHAHIAALAITSARKLDSLPDNEKGYSHSQVTQAVAKVFEMLPTPDAGQDMKWKEFMDMLQTADER